MRYFIGDTKHSKPCLLLFLIGNTLVFDPNKVYFRHDHGNLIEETLEDELLFTMEELINTYETHGIDFHILSLDEKYEKYIKSDDKELQKIGLTYLLKDKYDIEI